jgi:hypothetical protein
MWCIVFEDFIEFLKNNQKEWDGSRVEYYALGYEFDWLIEKRKKDKRRQNGRNSKNNFVYIR